LGESKLRFWLLFRLLELILGTFEIKFKLVAFRLLFNYYSVSRISICEFVIAPAIETFLRGEFIFCPSRPVINLLCLFKRLILLRLSVYFLSGEFS
jgi:hypothetical protein